MNCKNCGTPLEDGQKFCMNCGTKVEPTVEATAVAEAMPLPTMPLPTTPLPSTPTPAPAYTNPSAPVRPGKGFAITSMVCGIVACVCCCFALPGIGFALPIVALVFGILTLVQGREGKGMAIAGIVLGGIALLLAITCSAASDGLDDVMENVIEDTVPDLDLYDNILDEIL